ncbi:Uncharacterized protein Rs2_12406 [Raphanus sativus]|uniref:Uncharacterized protein LOC108846147 n=1 Tax=Raphanus sativus TaxID=3726 RepID=A0A6J0MTI9_RAPSA|nr:uncharacterized protein LOC108846147 [Raphanus sativus]KAJ4908748.1 Uncharacterized protein Rs2_12406 [Raphanus sativus]
METPPSSTPLRRRNSISTITPAITSDIPFAIESSSTTPTSFHFELISLKPPSYTSLRDIISSPSNSSVNLPSVNGSSSPVLSTVGDISIRNPLVKQAAWSYLQPTALASSEDSPGWSRFLRGVWLHFSAGIQFLKRMFDWILQSICIHPQIVK